MPGEEVIKQLQDSIDRLREENEFLKAWMKELEARLTKHENAHTPPSLRRDMNRKREQNGGEQGKPRQKMGIKA